MAASDNSPISVYYSYISNNRASLEIKGGSASCYSEITGYSGITTKVKITMYLEKKTLWWWNEITSWTKTANVCHTTLSKKYTVSSGTYRLRVVYTVYSGNSSETITVYSNEATY